MTSKTSPLSTTPLPLDASLFTTPTEILQIILRYVSLFDVLQLRASARFLYQIITPDSDLWYFHGMGAWSEGYAGWATQYRRNFGYLIKMAKNMDDQVAIVACALDGFLCDPPTKTVMHSLLLPFLLDAILTSENPRSDACMLQLLTTNLATFWQWTTHTWGLGLALTMQIYCQARDGSDEKSAASCLWETLIAEGTARLGKGRLVSTRAARAVAELVPSTSAPSTAWDHLVNAVRMLAGSLFGPDLQAHEKRLEREQHWRPIRARILRLIERQVEDHHFHHTKQTDLLKKTLTNCYVVTRTYFDAARSDTPAPRFVDEVLRQVINYTQCRSHSNVSESVGDFDAIDLDGSLGAAPEMIPTIPPPNLLPPTSHGYGISQKIVSADADSGDTRNHNISDPGPGYYVVLVQQASLAVRNRVLSRGQSTTITESMLLDVLKHAHSAFTEVNWREMVKELEVLATRTRQLGFNTGSGELATQLLDRATRMATAAVDCGLLQSDRDGNELLRALEQVVQLGLLDSWDCLLTALPQSSMGAIEHGSFHTAKSALHLWTAVIQLARRPHSTELLRTSRSYLNRKLNIRRAIRRAITTNDDASVRMTLEIWQFLKPKASQCDFNTLPLLAQSAQFSTLAVPLLFQMIDNVVITSTNISICAESLTIAVQMRAKLWATRERDQKHSRFYGVEMSILLTRIDDRRGAPDLTRLAWQFLYRYSYEVLRDEIEQGDLDAALAAVQWWRCSHSESFVTESLFARDFAVLERRMKEIVQSWTGPGEMGVVRWLSESLLALAQQPAAASLVRTVKASFETQLFEVARSYELSGRDWLIPEVGFWLNLIKEPRNATRLDGEPKSQSDGEDTKYCACNLVLRPSRKNDPSKGPPVFTTL